jgi:hypothetical protein
MDSNFSWYRMEPARYGAKTSRDASIIANKMIGTFRYIVKSRMDKVLPQPGASDSAPVHP